MSSRTLSSDGRWEITRYLEKDSSSYFDSETRWELTILNTKTKKTFRLFYYSESGDVNGWEYSGVRKLTFTEDSSAVIAEHADGKIETIPLPAIDTFERFKTLLGP